MRHHLLAAGAFVALLAAPLAAQAQSGAAAGATTGAVGGAIVGGPGSLCLQRAALALIGDEPDGRDESKCRGAAQIPGKRRPPPSGAQGVRAQLGGSGQLRQRSRYSLNALPPP